MYSVACQFDWCLIKLINSSRTYRISGCLGLWVEQIVRRCIYAPKCLCLLYTTLLLHGIRKTFVAVDSSLLHTSQHQFSTYGRWSLATVGLTVRNSLLDPVSNLIVTKTVFSRLLDKFLLACTSTRLSIMGFFYFVLVFLLTIVSGVECHH